MSKWGGLSGALLGAGGATAYYNGLDASSFLGPFFGGGWGGGQRWAAQGRSSGELDDLYKLVERLSRDVHRSQGSGVTVIHGSNGSSAVFTYGGLVVISTLGVLYIRGWKFSDFLYVTRAGMQKSLAGVTTSVEGLTQRVSSVRQFVAAQLDTVKRRQEDTIKAQEALKVQLKDVGEDVENTRTDVAEVHADLSRLGTDLNALTEQQTYTSEGVFLLCSMLGDIMKGSNIRSQSTLELEKYLKRSASGKVPGLEWLLEGEGEEKAPKSLSHGAQRMALAASTDTSGLDSPDLEHIRDVPKLHHSGNTKPSAPSQANWISRRFSSALP